MADLLANQTAVVTGGASGLGRAIAIEFARHGADVVIADLRETPRTADTTPTQAVIEDDTAARVRFVECDVTEPVDVRRAVEAADRFGGIDVMVNNAGISRSVEFGEGTEADYDAVMDVNLKGTYLGSREAGVAMLDDDGGAIVNIASTAADRGYAGGGSYLYAASKGGVRSMTYSLAAVLGPEVRVNAIQPGFTLETGLAAGGFDQDYLDARAAETAMGRLGRPADVANVAVFLASDLAGYVTAESVLVDGGWVHTGGP